jgi:hypothetical protein
MKCTVTVLFTLSFLIICSMKSMLQQFKNYLSCHLVLTHFIIIFSHTLVFPCIWDVSSLQDQVQTIFFLYQSQIFAITLQMITCIHKWAWPFCILIATDFHCPSSYMTYTWFLPVRLIISTLRSPTISRLLWNPATVQSWCLWWNGSDTSIANIRIKSNGFQFQHTMSVCLQLITLWNTSITRKPQHACNVM